MEHNRSSAPGIVRLTIKAVFVAATVFLLVLYLSGMISVVMDSNPDISKSEGINHCERHYQEKDFGSLQNVLALYDLYDDTYDVYWEAATGYEALIRYYQWHEAAKQDIEGAQALAENLHQQLETMAQNPAFPKNAHILNEFLQQADALDK